MWSARARWKLRSGALESAVVLVQGTHADWEDVEEETQSEDSRRIVLGQPDQPAPCEITIDFPETSFFVSLIALSSTARACEVYSRNLGSQDHEYVCTVRGKEQKPPSSSPAFPTPPKISRQEPPPTSPAFPTPPESSHQEPSSNAPAVPISLETSHPEPPPEAPPFPFPPETSRQETPSSPPASSTPPEASLREPSQTCPTLPLPLETSHQSLLESQDAQPDEVLGLTAKPDFLPPKQKLTVPFHTCGIKLARGPALTSLRLKFVSLQNKAELQIDPIRIYASRGPTAAAPPRLTGNSLSALAPLLPALGPLFSSGVPGIPQLPGAFSHLLPPQQSATEARYRETGNGAEDSRGSLARAENGSVHRDAAKGGHSQPAVPEGLAQLMASMQGLRAGRGHSHSAGAAHSDLASGSNGSAQQPPMNLAALMAAVGNSRGVSPGGVTAGSSNQEAVLEKAEPSSTEKEEKSVAGTESRSGAMQQRESGSKGETEQSAILATILRRLDGLEGTCLRIEKAVTGALTGFDARLRRLEERDAARGRHANGTEGVSERRHRAEAPGVNGHDGLGERGAGGEELSARGKVEDRGGSAVPDAVLGERRGLAGGRGGLVGQTNAGASEATEFVGNGTEPAESTRRFARGAGQDAEEEGRDSAAREASSAASGKGGKRIPPETGADAPETVPYEEAEAAAVL